MKYLISIVVLLALFLAVGLYQTYAIDSYKDCPSHESSSQFRAYVCEDKTVYVSK